MRKILFGLATLLTINATNIFAQQAAQSPASSATGKIGNATITINYGSPSVKGRAIWGELVPYGKVWRTGANKATTFETDADITVEGQPLKKGKYALFTIPEKNEWVIIFNKTTDQWGSFNYKQDDDVLRVKSKPSSSNESVEALKFEVGKNAVTMKWEKLSVSFGVK
ncbi:MAG: DUF2911 domain-containing protein [Chitinophagaceae bacterium]|jgi:hypothetical protein